MKLTRVSEEEAKTIDPEKVGRLVPIEVEGQEVWIPPPECAWCGQRMRVERDPDYFKFVQCTSCGKMSRV